jgi:hypothetical protein
VLQLEIDKLEDELKQQNEQNKQENEQNRQGIDELDEEGKKFMNVLEQRLV